MGNYLHKYILLKSIMRPFRKGYLGINPRGFRMFTPHPKGWGKHLIIRVIMECTYPVIPTCVPTADKYCGGLSNKDQSWGFNPFPE